MPTTYAFPGYVGDVVTLTGRIESTWAEAIRDRAWQVFDTAANRTSGLASPQVGQMSVLTNAATATDTGIWQYVGATDGWTKPWNLPWGEISYVEITSNQTGIGAGPTDVTSLTTGSITYLANRKIEINYQVTVTQQTTGTASMKVFLTDGSNNNLCAAYSVMAVDIAVGSRVSINRSWRRVPGAGALTAKLRAGTSAGTMSIIATSGAAGSGDPGPAFIRVLDHGPSGAPA